MSMEYTKHKCHTCGQIIYCEDGDVLNPCDCLLEEEKEDE